MRTILASVFLLMTLCVSAQYRGAYVYDSQGRLIAGTHIRTLPGAILTLTDTINHNYFVLDSAHINIYAYNPNGDTLWITDPWKDNHIMEYRTKRPVIVDYHFGTNPGHFTDKIKSGTKVIWVVYNNTQFGFIDMTNGKYYWCGQD